ncbi:MAG: hypothetical protein U9Q39_00280, partial [Pseudomonadota bacterium]|nr:hypothetical protein [Pseudomonadota bacterium]
MKRKSIGAIGVLIFLLVYSSVSFALNIFSSRRVRAYENKVVELESTTERFITSSQHNTNLKNFNSSVQEYNAWIGEYQKKLEKMMTKLEAIAKKVADIKTQVKRYDPLLKNRPSANDSFAVNDYNKLVTRRDVLVAKANSLLKEHSNGVAIYNSEVEKLNKQKERRSKKLNTSRNQYITKSDTYKDFIESDKDV